MELKDYLTACTLEVDMALERFLPAADLLPARLHQAMRYSIFAGGKRIRPVLMIAACEAVGGVRAHVIPAACAMEMIHTYSLIHDDLPAMDNDDFRRGRPTNHKVYGDATAILAGDALLTQAFLLLGDSGQGGGTADARLKVVHLMAQAAGSLGMVGGQVVDMESEGKAFDLPTLEYIHTRKTGALIRAAIKCGGLLGGGDEAALHALARYGEAAGLAFQIADDVLNVVGTREELGKGVGSDQARGKATYPALFGLEDSRCRARELRDRAVAALEPFGAAAEPLRAIAHYIVDRSC